jgi:hypothetical protein
MPPDRLGLGPITSCSEVALLAGLNFEFALEGFAYPNFELPPAARLFAPIPPRTPFPGVSEVLSFPVGARCQPTPGSKESSDDSFVVPLAETKLLMFFELAALRVSA